jgi:putative endonuclease
MYTVYALKSVAHNWIYVGMTDNLQRRLGQHQAKQNTSTQYYAPLVLFYKEEWPTTAEARKREKYFKTAAAKKG